MHDRLWAWFETHRKEVVWGAVVVVVAGFGTGFFVWRHGERESDANEALSRLTSRGSSNPETLELPESLLKVAADYPNTDAGGRALLLAGAHSYAQGKYPEAKMQFERYLREYRGSSFADQALFGVAVCLDAQGKTAETVVAYNDIIQHYPTENVAPQSRFALARIYEKQGKLDQARDIYTELSRANAFGSISSEAGMRLEELFTKHPDQVLARRVSTNVPTINLPKP